MTRPFPIDLAPLNVALSSMVSADDNHYLMHKTLKYCWSPRTIFMRRHRNLPSFSAPTKVTKAIHFRATIVSHL